MGTSKGLLQIYAIVINIVAVITFLICITNLIFSFIDKSDPIHSSRSTEKLASFEAYKMEAMRSVDKDQAYIATDDELRAMYKAAVDNNMQRILHGIKRSITVNGVLLVLSIILFAFHWRLMKKTGAGSDN